MAAKQLSCAVEHCDLNFSSQRELHRHEGEPHGELRCRLRACCGSPGATSADAFESHNVKEQVQNVVFNARPEVQAPVSAEGQAEVVIVDRDSRQSLKAFLPFNNSSETQPTAPALGRQIVSIPHNQYSPEPSVTEPPHIFSYTPLPEHQEGCVPRIFEET